MPLLQELLYNPDMLCLRVVHVHDTHAFLPVRFCCRHYSQRRLPTNAKNIRYSMHLRSFPTHRPYPQTQHRRSIGETKFQFLAEKPVQKDNARFVAHSGSSEEFVRDR